MKQAVTLPTLAELDSLLDAHYWKAHNTELPKELLTLKKAATSSLASLAEAAKQLNTRTPFYTPKPYFKELYELIMAVHQNDAKALRLQTKIKFKISVWHWEQQLALALQSQDIATQSKACLELGLLYQHSSEEMRYEQALSYFSKVIKLGYLKDTPVALRKRADLYLEKGKEDLGLQDLQALCHLAPDNPRAQIEYGQALIVAERHAEAAKAAEQALALKPNDPAANDLLQMAKRNLSARSLNVNVEVSDTSPKHEARDKLHEIYLKRLTSNVPSARQDGFRQLMAALEPCKGEIKSLLEVMNPANFQALLESAPLYFEIEMPSHADTLQSDFKELHAAFEDCLILYLVAKSFMSPQHQIKFYHNMSQILAKKGYYYQDAAVKNTGNPVDALDYALLILPYDSADLLSLYAAGTEQIVVEYHYQQGIAVLKLAAGALQNYEKTLKETDIEDFLRQFKALLKVANASQQYPNSAAMQALQQECCRYLSSPALLAVFETMFRFTLKRHATDTELLAKEFPVLLELINAWGRHDLANAKQGLRLFNAYLVEKKLSLSKDIFYTTATEQANDLLLQFEQNQSLFPFMPEAKPDVTWLIQEIRNRFASLLTIGQDLNTRSVIALQKQISIEALVILNSFLSAIENTLGPAPCAFSILGLGSYSRGEMGLCSDIDFAILVSDESSVQHPYFKSFLSLLVHLRRGLPPNVLTIESKDLQTLFGQEKSLMHTPEEMVSEHCPLYTATEIKSQKDRLTNTESYSVRRARLIFNSQTQPQESKALYEDYQSRIIKQLQTLDSVSSIPYYQMVGQVCLEEDFKKQDGAALIDTTETTTINLKKTHLRPLTLWLLNVATYFGIAENNSWGILDALNQQSRIAPVFLQEVGEALTTLHRLRLKLHHAWLTQPKPSELQFDAWLEMPANDNVPPSTRDFYLDAAQRETLDAIQRRIIEPLTETISAFGATLPVSQFDPTVHYFEVQFKALNQKHIVESHSKALPILAEIALRHPPLLRPSLMFRDLLPQLKVAYLDALDVALQGMEQAGSTKEIAELKALVETLWHYPTEDGWRAESYRLERAWNQQLMRLVNGKALSKASNALSLVQNNRPKHYTLRPEIASQLFTAQGEWQPKAIREGNHLVYRIMDASKKETLCWAKIYPEQPGIEWLMLHLDQRLGIYGIPCSTLVNIHHNGRNSAVLLSADVPHPNLLETLKTTPQTLQNLNRAHFFKTLMRVLLTNPEDDKGDDYFLKLEPEGLKLIRIDNERAFFTPESSEGILKIQKLQVKSIVYCLDLLMEPIKTGTPNVDAAVRDFLQLKPYALLKSLLLELKALQPLWQSLFSEVDIETHYHNKKPWLSLPILYVPQEMVKELSVRMESLQTLLALSPKTTGLQLLSTVQPKLGAHYLQGFKQYQNNQNAYSQVMARFDLSPGRQYKKQEQGLFSLHGTAAVTQSLRLSGELSLKVVKSIWQGKAYTADTILEQIEHWEADRSKDIYNGLLHPDPAVQKKAYVGWQQLSNRQRVLLFKDFSEGIRKNANVDIRLQQAILAALPSTTFHTLDLSAFSKSLEDKLLISILKTGGGHLIELTLNSCQGLSDAIPGIIAENCSNLKILKVSHMRWKSFSKGLIGRSAIAFPSLERLEMQNCEFLEYFIIEAPQADIILQGCITLKHVQFSSDLSVISTKQSEPGKFQCQLSEAYLLGTGVLKNLTQAYYWKQLSPEHKHFRLKINPMDAIEDLKINNVLQNLNLESNDIDAIGVTALSEALKVNSGLQDLNLGWNKIGPMGAVALSEALKVNSALQSLNLESNNIDDTGATALSEALKVNSTLHNLNLVGNRIGPRGATALSEVLKVNSVLQNLNLWANRIGPTGATALSEALKVNSTLQHLNLRQGKIEDTGVTALSEVLKANSTLRDLNLDYNQIDSTSVTVLSEVLKVNSALQSLSLAENPNITSTGAIALSEALKVNSSLQNLNLCYTNIGDTGAMALSEVLKVNSTLQDLNLSLNNIGPTGTLALSTALKVNNTLQNLNLRGGLFEHHNKIGDTGAMALSEALKVNSTLQHLNLDNNNIGSTGALALSEVLKVNSTLQSLELSENNLNDNEGREIVVQINESLAKNKQNAQKQPPAQKPLPRTKPLEKKTDAVLAVPLAFQYPQQALNSRRSSVNSSYQYEDNDIHAILAARLKQLRAQNPVLIKLTEILAAVDNIADLQLENRLRQEAKRNKGERTLLIPCNLGNAHWVGILLLFSTDGQILRAEYLDSLKRAALLLVVPQTFQIQLQAVYPSARFEIQTFLQQSDSTSCGTYAIENLLTSALGILPPEESDAIRRLHLEALKQYNPNFYSAFNERQRNNRPTTANLQEQLGYLDMLKGIWFSKPELNRILAIKQCLSRLSAETQAPLLQAFKTNSAHTEAHDLHLDNIRIALQDALRLESKTLAELMELLFENWQPENPLTLAKLKFRLSYNEILAITESYLLPEQVSGLQQTLAEQIKQDEAFTRALQAKLWDSPESSLYLPNYTEQYQVDLSNEQTDTNSAAWVEPLTLLRRSNAHSNRQFSAALMEEKQPRAVRERPKPVFRANIGDGL